MRRAAAVRADHDRLDQAIWEWNLTQLEAELAIAALVLRQAREQNPGSESDGAGGAHSPRPLERPGWLKRLRHAGVGATSALRRVIP